MLAMLLLLISGIWNARHRGSDS